MRRLSRIRRPLLALVALLLALVIGYAVKALDSGGDHPAGCSSVATATTAPPCRHGK